MTPQSLTMSELRVINLIAQGKSNQEIADATGWTVGTVKTYVSRILEKLSLPNRTAVAVWVVKSRKGV